MLLLLTLALLASPTYRAQNVLGNTVGTYFYVHGEDHGELKGIRIFLTAINRIKGIQLQFGHSWSDVYGSPSREYSELQLEDGEHVVKVDGSALLCLTSLSFTTNQGRVATFGVRRGRPFDASGGSGKHLVTVNGLYAPGLCIKGMGFKWGDDAKGLMPTEPVKVSSNSSDISKEKEDKGRDKDADDEDDKDDDDDDDDQEEEKEE